MGDNGNFLPAGEQLGHITYVKIPILPLYQSGEETTPSILTVKVGENLEKTYSKVPR